MYRMEDIPIGAENAISRAALARKWNTDDRTAREIIARLRAEDNGDGYVIVSHSAGKGWKPQGVPSRFATADGQIENLSAAPVGGYYRTDNPAQIRRFYNETMNRARSTFKPLKKARRILKEIGA